MRRKLALRCAIAIAFFTASPVAMAQDWRATIEHADAAVSGRACGSAAVARIALHLPRESSADATMQLPGDVRARVERLAAENYRVVYHGQPIGRVERTARGWRARLHGGDEDCRFDALDVHLDPSDANVPRDSTPRESAALDDAIGRALEARDRGDIVIARRLLALVDNAGDSAPQPLIRALLHRARILIESGEIAAAEADIARTAALAQNLGDDAPGVQRFRESLALRIAAAHLERERVVRERLALESAFASAPGASVDDRIANAVYLAVAQIGLRRFDDAEATLKSVSAAVEKLSPTAPLRIDAVAAEALVDRGRGRYRESVARVAGLLQEVARIRGVDNFAYAQLGWRYALNATVAARPIDAIPALTRSVAWFATALGEDNFFTTSAREALAYTLAHADQLPEAIAIQRQIVAAYGRSEGATIAGGVTARHNLANFLGRDRRFQEAEALLNSIIVDGERAGIRGDQLAHLKLDLAHVLWQTRGGAAACSCVDDVHSAIAGGLTLPPNLASEFELLAAACEAQAPGGGGIAALRHVVAGRAGIFGPVSIGTLQAQAMLARAQVAAGELDDARATLSEFAASVEELRRADTPDAGGARNAFAEWLVSDALYAGYRDLAYLHARAGDAARAIDVAEAVRARSLNDAMGLAQDIAGLPSRTQYRAGALAARLREQDAEIALMAPVDPARVALEAARNDAAIELAELTRESAARAVPQTFDVERSRRVLPRGTAFVGVQVVHRGVWAYVVRYDRPPAIVMLDRAVPLLQALEALRTAWSEPQAARAPIWQLSDGRYVNALAPPDAHARRVTAAMLADTLGEALLAPLMPALRGTKAVIVAADGPLTGIPFDALAVAGVPFGAQRDVRYAPSLTVWAARAASAPLPRYQRDLVAIGAPDYAGMAPGAAGPLPARAFAPLPGAVDELAMIGRVFPAGRRALIAGDQASKTRFVALARDGTLASARYLHVAAHGVLAAEAPQWSSLVLAGDGGPGYVTAAEIATLDIRAELVVLSACETALGKEVAGEGLFGLPYALSVAGARATLLTLWPVADGPTALFMRRFYTRLAQRTTPAAALAATKRDFMRSKDYSAPFYWAPFALYGG